MKVLVIHNAYRSSAPSGEDAVVGNESALLEEHGVRVALYRRSNDDIGGGAGALLRAARETIWSSAAYRDIRALIRRERPDVAHVHNLWYRISPAAYEACFDARVPVVQTVHNFRMFCANGLLLRDGHPCEDCLGRLPWRGITRGCYRSRLASLPVVASESFHGLRGTWLKRVDAFIALSRFSRALLERCGIPPNRLTVKPNFLPREQLASEADEGFAVYIGRLSIEKGVETLIDAASRVRQTILIIGDGALRPELEMRVAQRGLRNVQFLGKKAHAETMSLLSRASYLVFPSICYENFPMAILEAFACGKPVVAARRGAAAEMVEHGNTGLLFAPGDARDLAEKMGSVAADRGALRAMGRSARAEFEQNFTAEANWLMLRSVYEGVIQGSTS